MFHGYMSNIWGDDYKHPMNPMPNDRTLKVVSVHDYWEEDASLGKKTKKKDKQKSKKILSRKTTQESAIKGYPDFYTLRKALKHPDPVVEIEPIPQHEDDFDGAYKKGGHFPGFPNNIASVVRVDQTPCAYCKTLYQVKIMQTIYMTCDCGRTYR